MAYHETLLRDFFLRLASSHLLVQSRLVESESFYIEALRILRLYLIEVVERFSTLKVEVSEAIVNELLETFFRESRLDESLELCSGADSYEALFDHFPILRCIEANNDVVENSWM